VIKEFGLSLASAVFLDALVVRCLLLPAVLHLIGRRTWSLPRRLDRILPHLNIEGTLLPAQPPEPGTPSGSPSGARRPGRPEVATEGAEG
jgi:RND superfamily putative drug exporter